MMNYCITNAILIPVCTGSQVCDDQLKLVQNVFLEITDNIGITVHLHYAPVFYWPKHFQANKC